MRELMWPVLLLVALAMMLWEAREKPPRGWPHPLPVPKEVHVKPNGTECRFVRLDPHTVYQHCVMKDGVIYTVTTKNGRIIE